MQNSIKPIALLTACGLIACSAGAQTLFSYSGADRMERIVAAGKKEGTLTIYTTFAEKDQPTLLSVWVQAYNTQLIKKGDLPRTYKDLLDPRWKGKLGIEAKNQDWFASVVDVMGGGEKGLKFFRDLVAQNGISLRTGHTLLTNMVIAGEVPLALTLYNYMPEQAKKRGAPIDWFALEPAE